MIPSWRACKGPLKEVAADTVWNMSADVSLDSIIKKYTIIYGSVKSFDVLMRDFYRADKEDEESVSSFAIRLQGRQKQNNGSNKYCKFRSIPESCQAVKTMTSADL